MLDLLQVTCKNLQKKYKVRKDMHIFHDISNLLVMFQMFCIYHWVTILAYEIYYQYTIWE